MRSERWMSKGKYLFTNHFFDEWRSRIKNSPSREKIVNHAYGRLTRSHIISLRGKEELRQHGDIVFAIRRKDGKRIVKTVMYSIDYHRFTESEYYKEHKDKIDSVFDKKIICKREAVN